MRLKKQSLTQLKDSEILRYLQYKTSICLIQKEAGNKLKIGQKLD